MQPLEQGAWHGTGVKVEQAYYIRITPFIKLTTSLLRMFSNTDVSMFGVKISGSSSRTPQNMKGFILIYIEKFTKAMKGVNNCFI